jgi:hypothetical protein
MSQGHHGEGRGWVHPFLEAEIPAVERNRVVDVVDDVADADSGHGMAPASPGVVTGRITGLPIP